ncbi:RecB family exonuclease [Thermovibrio ammonificans]|jgi:putative RecB family exonuclease|uniref:PD-(D/E)XK endonuclease-like domain-containing protein n=1 Tax=Thermovibrio ammonificans (strain DSM 15698 / JCM 12110 / HB-1) TaxID=648996 RepID=E8T2Q2_THEA1|nr:PD-(D/E)XK nuclease family protein [Thermovibrio ammonificans]ADU95977.1 hypothetical protein Theam_0003 [Thermovibrio ammonificans HB-1]
MAYQIEQDLTVGIEHLRPWSFSKVQKAKRCQYEFFFRYVQKLEPLERADFLVLGSGVHFVLENALNAVFLRRKPLSKELLLHYARLYKEQEPLADLNRIGQFFPNILKFVNGQLRRVDRGELKFWELELAVDRELRCVPYDSGGVFLRGKLDFLFSKGETLYIVDHKTSRSHDFDNRVKTQLRWYALLAAVKFPQFQRFALELHNVRYGTVKRVVFSRREIEAFKVKLVPIIESVEEEFLGKSFRELTPSPSELNCRWCEFRHLCPEALS